MSRPSLLLVPREPSEDRRDPEIAVGAPVSARRLHRLRPPESVRRPLLQQRDVRLELRDELVLLRDEVRAGLLRHAHHLLVVRRRLRLLLRQLQYPEDQGRLVLLNQVLQRVSVAKHILTKLERLLQLVQLRLREFTLAILDGDLVRERLS